MGHRGYDFKIRSTEEVLCVVLGKLPRLVKQLKSRPESKANIISSFANQMRGRPVWVNLTREMVAVSSRGNQIKEQTSANVRRIQSSLQFYSNKHYEPDVKIFQLKMALTNLSTEMQKKPNWDVFFRLAQGACILV